MLNKKKLGIYLHIPFCEHKCGYCDFYSASDYDKFNSDFVEALCLDIEKNKLEVKSEIDSIFFGGGTPSMLSFSEFNKIFNTLHKNFNLSNDCEITIEANPGTIKKDVFKSYLGLGINRISFGVQSFIDTELKQMERIHSAEQAKMCIKTAQDSGVENISLDLIFALPHQTLKNWSYTLEEAIKLNTQHISAYSLIFEKNTPFYNEMIKGNIAELGQETERELFDYTMKTLEQNAFKQYEVSNYAKQDNLQSRHNLKYWLNMPYHSFGPSSHAYDGINKRWWRIRSTSLYISKIIENNSPISGEEFLDKEQLINERIMLSFRLIRGLDLEQFLIDFEINFESKFKHEIEKFSIMGLLLKENNFIKLSREGLFYADEIIRNFAV